MALIGQKHQDIGHYHIDSQAVLVVHRGDTRLVEIKQNHQDAQRGGDVFPKTAQGPAFL